MATPIGPYSPSVRAGDFIIVSGQLGVVDGALVDGVTAQTTQAVANLADRLAEYGADPRDFENHVFSHRHVNLRRVQRCLCRCIRRSSPSAINYWSRSASSEWRRRNRGLGLFPEASRLGAEAALSVPANYTDPMAGAIAIIAVLAIFPVLIAMSGGVASAILGAVLQRDGERRFEAVNCSISTTERLRLIFVTLKESRLLILY